MLGRSWLRLPPLRALSETWLSSVFIGSCPGLTSFGGVEEGWGGGGSHSSRRPTVPNSSGDRSGEMHEFHMGEGWGECGTKMPLKMCPEFDSSRCRAP